MYTFVSTFFGPFLMHKICVSDAFLPFCKVEIKVYIYLHNFTHNQGKPREVYTC